MRGAIAAFVREYGLKRGIHLAAEEIGMGERAARHAHEGSWFAADADRAARADAARMRLLRERIARLQAEINELAEAPAGDAEKDRKGGRASVHGLGAADDGTVRGAERSRRGCLTLGAEVMALEGPQG